MTEVEQEIAENQLFTLEKISMVKTSLDQVDAELPNTTYAELKELRKLYGQIFGSMRVSVLRARMILTNLRWILRAIT